MSYTQIEYDAAANHGLSRFMFLTADEFREPLGVTESPEKRAKQRAFRDRAKRYPCGLFSSPDQLATQVPSWAHWNDISVDG